MIETPDGPVAVERLRAGDLVSTLDNGAVALVWTGQRMVGADQQRLHPNLAPIEFAAGVLDNTAPLRVSPQHRMLLRGAAAEMYFGDPEVLASALGWLGSPGVTRCLPTHSVTYVHIACATHEIITANGALAETLLPAACDAGHLRNMLSELKGVPAIDKRPARPILRPFELRAAIADIPRAA